MIDREKLYDLLYDKADALFKEYNPCNIRKENGELTCNGIYSDNPYLCCFSCEHKSKTGCTIKSLGCKVSLCETSFNGCCNYLEDVGGELLDFRNKMDKLRKICWKYELCYDSGYLSGSCYHKTKQEILSHAIGELCTA